MGIDDPQIGMNISLSYQLGTDYQYISDEFEMCIRDREYAVLEEKAAAATAHHNELSAQIKAAEKRMAEIAVLRLSLIHI